MRTLEEIFKDSPALLETKEVKEVIEHFQKHYKRLAEEHIKYRQQILNLCLRSDLFIKDGDKSSSTIDKIIDL